MPKAFKINLIFIIILVLCQSLSAKSPPSIPAQDYTIWGQVYLKDPQQTNSVKLTHNDSGYTISLKIDNVTLASYLMGSDINNADYYVLKVPMSLGISGQNLAKYGDFADIYINDILANEVYLEPDHTNIKLPIKIGKFGQTVAMDIIHYVDKTPPYTTNYNPLPDSSVNRDTNIYVEVEDNGTGVDINSLQMSVEGNVVSPLVKSIQSGYSLTYISPAKFQSDQVVDVIISAADLSNPPNKLLPSFSYHFTTKNRLPIVNELSISPSTPKSDDELSCSYDYTDADGDAESGSEIRWYKDGVYQSVYKNKVVVSSVSTKKGQVWYVTVKPKDGIDFGEVYKSTTVTVGNTSPSVSGLNLSPSTPKSDDELSCSYDYTDADGDAESGSEILWYKGGVIQSSYTGIPSLPSGTGRKGDVWSFSIRPKDGVDFGEQQTSPSVTIGNSAPVVSNVKITPSSPKESEQLICSYDYTDTDGDAESGTTLRWYRNGALQDKYNDLKGIPAGVIGSGDEWRVVVRGSDGVVQGKYETSETLMVGNTSPEVSALIVEVMPTGDLTSKYTYYDAGGDKEDGSEIRWYMNNTLQSQYNDQKTVFSADIHKGEIWHFSVRPKDGVDYGALQVSPELTIGNSAPVVINVVVTPNTPLTTDDLVCSYDYRDGNGDAEIGSEIRWYKDSIAQEQYNDQKTIPSSMTVRGEKWYVTVRPKDGVDYGEQRQSGIVTIANTAPLVKDVAISPSTPKSDDELSCSYDYTDADGDAESGSEIRWYKDGVYQSVYKNKVVVSSVSTKKGQVWYVTVKPKDGTDYGEQRQSGIVTIVNTVPIASDLKITPLNPVDSSELDCDYSYSDSDDDIENGTEIRWYKDKILQETYNDQILIPSGEIHKGENWYFTIRPKDSTDYGEIKTSPEVTIGNTLPTASNLMIKPLNPLVNDGLACSYEFSDANGDVENGTEIRWYKDDVLQEAYNDQKVIPSGVTVKGQKWQFTVKPKDGTDYGELKRSPIVKIGNILPQVKELNIVPEKPLTDDILECKYVYNDADGDSENGTEIKWYKDGVYQSTYKNKISILANSTKKGQTWYVTVRPNDGSDFGEIKQSTSIQIGNTPPITEDLKLKPINPLTQDDLTCSYSYNDSDSDPENGTEIRWYKDNDLQEKYNDQKMIPSNMTLKGEKWHFIVKPKDGSDYGELKASSDVTIGNTPPSVDNVTITPAKPTPEDILSFSYQYKDTDADTENGTKIIWYKNGEQQAKYDNITTIPPIELETGQKWYVVIQPCDGTQFGETKQSKIITIGEKTPVNPTENTPPEAVGIIISPEKPLTTDNLQCEYNYADVDNDPENGSEIRWYKDGVLQKAYNDKKTVLSKETSKGENWYFTIRPKDGKTFGDLKTSPTVMIINTPPTIISANIKPTLPKRTDNLICDYIYSDVDNDTENGTEIKWYRNNELQPSYNDLRIIPPVELIKGQKWYYTVRPKDGTYFGELKISTVVTIGNTAPIAANLAISPLQPMTTNELTCSYEYTDADNDNETGTDIRWYKNEELQLSYSDQRKIPSEETTKGQKWYFTVRPRDGILYGEVQKSSIVTIEDTPPTISDINITPVLPMKGDSLVCHYTYNDADSDIETDTEIKWYKDNKQQTEFNNQTQIPSSAFSKGEKWYFRIRTHYDKKLTDWQESPTITIGNSPPIAVIEAENYVVAVGSTIKFFGSKSSDADNDKLLYKWDFNTNNGVSIDSIEQDPIYAYENEGEYVLTLMVNDGEIDSTIVSTKVKVEAKLILISASYNIPDTKLNLKFNKPIQPMEFDGEMLHIQTAGNVDIVQLHSKCQPIINWTDPSELLIDLSNSLPTALGLVLASVVNHQKVGLILQEGIFIDTSGISNQPMNLTLDMVSGRYKIGLIGDVNGSGTLTTYDAELILQSVVNGIQTLPIYDALMDVSGWLAIHEYNYNAVMDVTDIDKDGQLSSYDASLILQKATKLVPDSSNSVISSTFREATLKIDRHNSDALDMSVMLDDSSGVYSIDVTIIYDPQELVINYVSKSSVVSDWLFAQAVPESGKLKVSMTGISTPNGNGSIADLSFKYLMEDNAKLPSIAGIQLNGRRIGVSIENIPDRSNLQQNYPNPCNNGTWIPYLLSSKSEAYMSIYNSSGKLVRRFNMGTKEPGDYSNKSKAAYWDCRNESDEKVSSGIYFYELHADRYVSIKKMVVIQQ